MTAQTTARVDPTNNQNLNKIKIGDKVYFNHKYYTVLNREVCKQGPCKRPMCSYQFTLEDEAHCIHSAQCCVIGAGESITKHYHLKKLRDTILSKI